MGNLASNIAKGISDVFSDFFANIVKILDYLNPFSENFILNGVFKFLNEILSYINPFSENFFVYKLLELLKDLLNLLFVPDNNFFSSHLDDLKYKLSEKIPYQDYIDMFETIQQVESGEDININLEGYKIGNNTYNIKDFINFNWITKYKKTWYSWIRGITFVLLIIYHINQMMKLFRGYSIGDGSSKNDNQITEQAGGGKK